MGQCNIATECHWCTTTPLGPYPRVPYTTIVIDVILDWLSTDSLTSGKYQYDEMKNKYICTIKCKMTIHVLSFVKINSMNHMNRRHGNCNISFSTHSFPEQLWSLIDRNGPMLLKLFIYFPTLQASQRVTKDGSGVIGTHLYLTAIRVPTKVLSLPVISPRVVSHII